MRIIGRSSLMLVAVLGVTGCPAQPDCPPCEEKIAEAPAVAAAEEAKPELEAPVPDPQLLVRNEDVVWKPCPPNLPEGCEMAVLEGDPRKPMLFTVRFRATKGFLMAPHSHPNNERVTVISGEVGVGFGDKVDKAKGQVYKPGDYYVNAKGANHFVWTDKSTILQVTGIGPWKADFLKPPSAPAAK